MLDRCQRLRHAHVMIRRRSWLEPSPWWHLAGLMFLTTLTTALVTTAALGNDPRQDYTLPVLVAAFLSGTGALVGGGRRNRSWRELCDDWLDDPEELVAAEQVVRSGGHPASSLQLLLAQRIADLRWREVGGFWLPSLLMVLAGVLVLMGGLGSRWWLAPAAAAGGAAVVTFMVSWPLGRRRAELAMLAPV